LSTLSEELKQATSGLHAEMESLPFFRALADGSLPLESYICQLRAFAVLFASLERSAADAADLPLRQIAAPLDGRYALLLQDLEVFADLLVPDIAAALQLSLKLAHDLRQLGTEQPRHLIGPLYALGGTVLGNRVHLGDVRVLLDRAGEGDAFYSGFGSRTDELWRTTTALLDLLDPPAEERSALIEVARDTFRELIAIHAALYPLPPLGERRLAATALNPEAGSHPIPEDPREVRAALAAGQRCRAEFPYFEARYGERGRRYTSSDVAWLATLPGLEESGTVRQALWLADLLARLGMPRILMERQLEILQEELSAQVPEHRDRYLRLTAAVGELRSQRLARLPEPRFSGLSGQVERALALCNPGVANLGVLIVASLTDEACGIPESAAALEAWLTGAGAFPPGFAAEVAAAFKLVRGELQDVTQAITRS
jgi:heme oxygenase